MKVVSPQVNVLYVNPRAPSVRIISLHYSDHLLGELATIT